MAAPAQAGFTQTPVVERSTLQRTPLPVLSLWLLLVVSGLWCPRGALAQAYSVLVTAAPHSALCNGTTNDAAAIQSAIDSVPAQGGTVLFPAGTLCGVGAAGVTVTDKAAVTLQAVGAGGGLKTLALGPGFSGYGPTMLHLVNCYRCAVRGLTIDGNGLVGNGVGIRGSNGVLFEGNMLRGTGLNGAVVTALNTNNRYVGNTISHVLNDCRGLWIGNPNAGEYETRPHLLRNTITWSTGGATAIAIAAESPDIRGNTLTSVPTLSAGAGIALAGDGLYVTRNARVTENTATGWPFHGIQSDITSADDASLNIVIARNTLRGNAHTGLYVLRARQWIVDDNVIEDNVDAGVLIGLAQDITLTNNRIQDTRSGASRTQNTGIRIEAVTSALDVQRVRLENNLVVNHPFNGIHVQNALPGTMDRIDIVRNQVLDGGGWGIAVLDVVDGNITHVVATGNVLLRNATGPIRMDPSDGVIN